MDGSGQDGKKVLLDGISKKEDLKDVSRRGRIVFEVVVTGRDSRFKTLSDLLETHGWICEENRATLTVPKDFFSTGDVRAVETVRDAIVKMKYLLKVARMDYDMRVISEAPSVGKVESVAKLKVGLVGDAAVGKTSLIRRFVLDQFDDKYAKTIGAKVSKKEIHLALPRGKHMRVDMMIWDVMGERNIAELYLQAHFKGMQGILAVADVTRADTLRSIDEWTASVREVAGDVPVYVLVNKMDLEDEFDMELVDVSKYSRGLGSPFAFTSAKTGKNVEKAFIELADWILSRGKQKMAVAPISDVSLRER
ncbi:MAG: GTP-binding protein [Candidatus Thermoplasmatota archaeon]|nr:GTP-binding protein [Candidatus Thermoplasmatota archaeon]